MRLLRAFLGRSNVVTFSGAGKRTIVTLRGHANSRRPSSPWMRPKPESRTPPKGSSGTIANEIAELMLTQPADSCSAISRPCAELNTAAPRP